MTNSGQPYGPIRYKQIVREIYLICKNINITYQDVMNMTVLEREYMLKFLVDDFKKSEEMMTQSKVQQ